MDPYLGVNSIYRKPFYNFIIIAKIKIYTNYVSDDKFAQCVWGAIPTDVMQFYWNISSRGEFWVRINFTSWIAKIIQRYVNKQRLGIRWQAPVDKYTLLRCRVRPDFSHFNQFMCQQYMALNNVCVCVCDCVFMCGEIVYSIVILIS